jgi:hypothetical protein
MNFLVVVFHILLPCCLKEKKYGVTRKWVGIMVRKPKENFVPMYSQNPVVENAPSNEE